ncbi:MAG: hypothetical protein RLZZ144_802, partial [Pseudomonadota bacterium]
KMLDEREGEVASEDLPRAFNRQTPLRRMAIVVAGPLANFLLAIVLYFALLVHGVPGLKPVLGDIKIDSVAAQADLRREDTIVSVNGSLTPSWQEVRWLLLDAVLQQAPVKLEVMSAPGQMLDRRLSVASLTPDDLDSDFLGKLGLRPFQPPIAPVIGKLVAGGVAEKAGVQVQDRIVSINGVTLSVWEDLVQAVRAHPAQTLSLEINRAGSLLPISLSPESFVEGGKVIGRIGVAPYIDRTLFDKLLTTVSYSPPKALLEAFYKTWDTALLSIKMMSKMVVGEVSLKNLSGPITIADYAGQSAQMGVGAYLGFLALISISLGVLNLLPIPLLDGGHLMYYSVELIKGSPVSERLWQIGQNIGIAMLVTMMAFALYNDISRLISG